MKQETASLNPAGVTIPRLLSQDMLIEAVPGLTKKWLERDRWAERRLPYVKFGRKVFYRAEDVAAFIEANTQPAAQ
jgi:hypothetical protein